MINNKEINETRACLLEVAKVWCLVTDRLEVVDRELDIGSACHGEEVQDLKQC